MSNIAPVPNTMPPLAIVATAGLTSRLDPDNGRQVGTSIKIGSLVVGADGTAFVYLGSTVTGRHALTRADVVPSSDGRKEVVFVSTIGAIGRPVPVGVAARHLKRRPGLGRHG